MLLLLLVLLVSRCADWMRRDRCSVICDRVTVGSVDTHRLVEQRINSLSFTVATSSIQYLILTRLIPSVFTMNECFNASLAEIRCLYHRYHKLLVHIFNHICKCIYTYLGFLFSRDVIRLFASSVSFDQTFGLTFRSPCNHHHIHIQQLLSTLSTITLSI